MTHCDVPKKVWPYDTYNLADPRWPLAAVRDTGATWLVTQCPRCLGVHEVPAPVSDTPVLWKLVTCPATGHSYRAVCIVPACGENTGATTQDDSQDNTADTASDDTEHFATLANAKIGDRVWCSDDDSN